MSISEFDASRVERSDVRLAAVAQRLPTNHFAFADGLRATAILFVVINHFALFGHLTLLGHKNDLAFLGRWGVNCFFLLSGFLLSRAFLKAILDPSIGFPSMRSFFLRRFYRIYPLYAVAVIFSGFVGIYAVGGSALPFIASHLAFAQFVLPDQINSDWNAPLWTMAIDIQFYIALPLVALLTRNALRGLSRARKRTTLFAFLAALSMLSLVYRYVAFKHAPLAANDFALALVYVRNFLGMLPAFAIGVALALAQIEFTIRPNRGVALATIASGAAIFTVLGLLKSGGSSLTVKVIADCFAAISAAALFYGLWISDSRIVARFMESRFVTEAAALAYGIYLFHWPILGVVTKAFGAAHGSRAGTLGALALSVSLILPVAYCMHRFVENPFLTANERLRRLAAR